MPLGLSNFPKLHQNSLQTYFNLQKVLSRSPEILTQLHGIVQLLTYILININLDYIENFYSKFLYIMEYAFITFSLRILIIIQTQNSSHSYTVDNGLVELKRKIF